MADPTPQTGSASPRDLRRCGIQTVRAHLALNMASVLLLTLAFPKPGWAVLAFLAPVPVGVLAMRSTRLWTLAWTTMLVFTAWWGLRVHWLSAISPAAPWGVAVVMSGYYTLMAVGLAQVQRRFRMAMTLALPIFWVTQEALRSHYPWGGFPWFTLGSSQAMWKPPPVPASGIPSNIIVGGEVSAAIPFPGGYLVQTADLFGVLTVSFLVAMTAGLIVDLIAGPAIKWTAQGRPRPRRTVVVAAVVWVLCFGGAMVYGSLAVNDSSWIGAEKQTARIAVIQTNIPQSNKVAGTPEQRAADWDTLFELTSDSLEQSAPDLVVWPETVVLRPINDEYVAWLDQWIGLGQEAEDAGVLGEDQTLYRMVAQSHYDRGFRDRLDAYAQAHGVWMIVGGRAQLVAGDERLMNSAFLIQPGASAYPRYSKQQLVPFGEYIPGGAWVKRFFMEHFSPYGPDRDYTLKPGAGATVFETPPFALGIESPGTTSSGDDSGSNHASQASSPPPLRVVTPICFEDVVGHVCRRMVYAPDGRKQADVLVNLTNDGWFAGTQQGYQHLQLATLRCIENRVPMARSVNTGVSGFIDANGRVLGLVEVGGLEQEVAGHAARSLTLDPRTTLYSRVGEAGPIGVGAAALLLWLGRWIPRRGVRTAA